MGIVLFSVVLMQFTGLPTMIAFVVGAVTSILCGWIGMKIAVFTNVRTTHQCWKDLKSGFDVAIQGGCVMGLSLVSIGVLALFVLIHPHHGSHREGFCHWFRSIGEPCFVWSILRARQGESSGHFEPMGVYRFALGGYDALCFCRMDNEVRGHCSQRHVEGVPRAVPENHGPRTHDTRLRKVHPDLYTSFLEGNAGS